MIRYVYEDKVEERLLSMQSPKDAGSASIFLAISNTLEKYGLEISTDQCYNGASNMSGAHSGLQKRVKDVSPRAIFTHCYAHCLNLVIVGALSTCRVARNFFALVTKSVCIFTNLQ